MVPREIEDYAKASFFLGGGGGGGDEGVGVWGVKVYYGRYANGKLIKYLYLL